jgi:hypothetical protein
MELITQQWATFSAFVDKFTSRNVPFLEEQGIEIGAFTLLVALNNVSGMRSRSSLRTRFQVLMYSS